MKVLITQSRPTLCNPTDCCPARLLCPWNSLGKNTGVGSHFLSLGDLPNALIEPRSPALQKDSIPYEPPGKPKHIVSYKGKQQNDVCMLSHSVMSDSFMSPWTITHQVPWSMEISRQEYQNRLPFPTAKDLPNPGIDMNLSHLLTWQVDSYHWSIREW